MRKNDPSVYDTEEGIRKYLNSYPRFHELLRLRREAHWERGESLGDFVILGAFTLDTFGQIGKIWPTPKVELEGRVPDVMEKKAFFAFMKETVLADQSIQIALSPVHIPPLNCQCPECGKYYGVDDCHDAYPMETRSNYLVLDDFVGKNFWEVRRWLVADHQVFKSVHPNIMIRNDRFINLRQDPYWDHEHPINKFGWVGKDEGIDDSYVIQKGDAISYDTKKHYHKACFVTAMTRFSQDSFKELLSKVGFTDFTMKSVPNKYGSFEYRGSWFSIATTDGVFTIGWRKRVIEITLHDWPVDCARLFATEGVTVGNQYVHAHSEEKAIEYLQVILQSARLPMTIPA
ncbi:MAG: hypothetical protein WC791_00850 [Candidatus Paceibacterota bacterium]|jgi:hypothetical protein